MSDEGLLSDRADGRVRFHESSHLTDALFSAMLDPIIILGSVRDDDGRIADFEFVDANPAACAYNHVPREAIVGQRLLGLFPATKETLFALWVEVVETGQPVAKDGEPRSSELDDGQELFYDVRAARLGDGLFYTWRDVTDRVKTVEGLQHGIDRLRAQLDAEIAPHITMQAVRDECGVIVDFLYVDANPAALAYLDMDMAKFSATRLMEMYPSTPATAMRDMYAHTVYTGEPLVEDDYRYPNEWFGGEDRWYRLRGSKVGDAISLSWEDVTEAHLAVQRITESEERYRLLADNAADIVLVIKDEVIDWISPSVERAFGSPPADWLGRRARDLINPDDAPAMQAVVAATLRGEDVAVRARGRGPNGVEHWVRMHARPYVESDGRISGLIASYHVIDDVMEAEEELIRRARFDSLTGLLNRSEVLQKVTQVANRIPRSGTQTAVLFCDIDHFKEINDEHGHAAGDEVLRTVGERVAAAIRGDDFAARIGGDELLILLPGVHSIDEATEVAEKIRTVTSQRVALGNGVEIAPQLSIGVTMLRPGETTDELVERADNAMYLAKKTGRNRVVTVT